MGKTKKRAASRMKEQRDSEIAAVAADVESQLPAGGAEEALFVLDTEGQGKKRRRRMAATEKKMVSGGIVLSNNVKKQLKAHSKEELQKIAEKGRKSLERKGRQGHAMKKEKVSLKCNANATIIYIRKEKLNSKTHIHHTHTQTPLAAPRPLGRKPLRCEEAEGEKCC